MKPLLPRMPGVSLPATGVVGDLNVSQSSRSTNSSLDLRLSMKAQLIVSGCIRTNWAQETAEICCFEENSFAVRNKCAENARANTLCRPSGSLMMKVQKSLNVHKTGWLVLLVRACSGSLMFSTVFTEYEDNAEFSSPNAAQIANRCWLVSRRITALGVSYE